MERFFRRLARDRSGATLPMVAMSMTVLLGFASLTVDLSHGYRTGQRLQATADAAAMAAAEQLALTGSEGGVARSYARLNMPAAEHGEVLAASDVTLGRWDAANRTFTASATPANAVRVTTRRAEANGNPLRTYLAGIIGINQIQLERTAIAAFQGQSVNCVLALRGSGSGIVANSDARLTTNRCNVHANSSSSNSMLTNANSFITAQNAEICTVGTVSGSGYSPAARTRCAVVADPLATLPEPTLPSCAFTTKLVVNSTRTLNPGRYCRGLELAFGANVTFNPGTYIIEGDKFTMLEGAAATGAGVTFILRDKNALLLVNKNTRLKITAPNSGTYKGVAIYGSRLVTDYVAHELNADAQSFVNGAIYLPRAQLLLNSASQFSSAGNCMSIIAWDIYLNSRSSVIVDSNYSGCGVSQVGGVTKTVSLVS